MSKADKFQITVCSDCGFQRHLCSYRRCYAIHNIPSFHTLYLLVCNVEYFLIYAAFFLCRIFNFRAFTLPLKNGMR